VCGFHSANVTIIVNIIAVIIRVMKIQIFWDAKILKNEGNMIL
jgi:hypothetical protein